MCFLESVDESQLDRLAVGLVEGLPGGIVFGIVGTLGAGKTTLVQSIARACGVDSADVTSPTFTLLQTYHGSVGLHHLDAYRVADEDEFLELGVEELFDDQQAWTLVEWADRVESCMPDVTVWIRMEIGVDERHRNLSFSCRDRAVNEKIQAIVEALR